MTLDFSPTRLYDLLVTAIGKQKHPEDRRELYEALEAGETDVYPEDDDGYRVVTLAGHKILKVHRSVITPRGRG